MTKRPVDRRAAAGATPLESRSLRRVGTLLGGKYRIERVLGVGGMATVYAAEHRNGHRVAIKILHEHLAVYGDTCARFLREGYVANKVGHPGAVRVLDDDVAEDGAAFLVMELLRGENLRARSRRAGGTLPVREVLALGHQLLDVLAAAHAAGIVHRDVKPENLFVTVERRLMVLDFGIARIDDPEVAFATATGARLGTPAFMPPELAIGKTAEMDGRTDLWSAGAALFTLISGEVVHPCENVAEMVVRAATAPARPLATVAPGVPAEVAAVVDRALRFRPDDRWPSAKAMRDAVAEAHAALYGEPVSIEAIGPVSGDGVEGLETGIATTELSPRSDAPDPGGVVTVPDDGSANRPPASRDGVETLLVESRPAAPPASAAATRPEGAGALPFPPTPRRRASHRRTMAASLVLAAVAVAAGVLLWRPAAPAPAVAASASAAAAGRPGCASSRACVDAHGGAPYVCRKEDGACVALETDACRVLAAPGDVGNDATVWIGAMWPYRDADPLHFGPRSANAVELARRDFAETSGGLPPAHRGGPKRPLAVVLCDDRAGPDRAAAHLVDDVRVPAVLGFASSKEVMELAPSRFLPAHVLVVVATGTATEIRDIPQNPGEPRLVWRTSTATDAASPALAAVLAQIVEPEIRAIRGALRPGEPIRVAQLRQDSLVGHSIVASRVATLRYNGKSVAENGDAFRLIARGDQTGGADLAAAHERTAREIVAYLPHVVVDMPPLPALLAEVERRWPASAGFRPRYLTEGTWVDLGGKAIDWRRDGLSRRLYSVEPMGVTPPLVRFALRYSELFDPRATPATAPNTPYDAFYLVAYAAAALGSEPVTGPSLARAFSRLLPPGEPVDVGPGGIYPALLALGAGRNVDLQGTASSLDLDPETGETSAPWVVYCVAPGKGTELPAQIESGLTLDVRRGKLVGTKRCP